MTDEDHHVLCICCIHVFNHDRPVLFICRDDDDGDSVAQYMCGQEDHFSASDGKAVGFSHLKDADPSILEPWLIAMGAAFERSSISDPWQETDINS